MLDDHDTGIGKQLLGIIVDELPVDEDIGLVSQNFVDFALHLKLLSLLDLGDFHDAVDLDLRTHDLDFVVVHGSVCDHDFGVLGQLLAASRDALHQDEAIGQVRVSQSATWLLDDFDVIKVARAFEAEDGLDSQLGEVVSLGFEQFAGERGECDVLEIFAELGLVFEVVESIVDDDFARNFGRFSPALDYNLRMDFLRDEFFGLTQELSCKNCDGCGAVANLLVLCFGNVDEDLGCWVVNVY